MNTKKIDGFVFFHQIFCQKCAIVLKFYLNVLVR